MPHHFVTLVACLLAGGLSIAATPNAAGQDRAPGVNLLPDPSSEQPGTSDMPGWKSRAWSGEAAVRGTVDAAGRSGNQCLSIASDAGADAAWTATVAVQPNTFYRLSGWIKPRDVRGALGAQLNIQNLQHVRSPRVAGTSDWTHPLRRDRTRRSATCISASFPQP